MSYDAAATIVAYMAAVPGNAPFSYAMSAYSARKRPSSLVRRMLKLKMWSLLILPI